MDFFSLLASSALFSALLTLFLLFQLLRSLIRKQIDEQIKEMIPIKAIRKRVGIRIKWKKQLNSYSNPLVFITISCLHILGSNTDEKIDKKGQILVIFIITIMNTIDTKSLSSSQLDPIDDYLECVTYCSISSSAEENDCQTICMERHLKSSYF